MKDDERAERTGRCLAWTGGDAYVVDVCRCECILLTYESFGGCRFPVYCCDCFLAMGFGCCSSAPIFAEFTHSRAQWLLMYM